LSEFRILAEDFSDLGDRVLVAGRIGDAERQPRLPEAAGIPALCSEAPCPGIVAAAIALPCDQLP